MSATAELRLAPDHTAADLETGSVFFIGNATVLIRFAGFTILTDPTFIHKHEQTWIGYGLHTTRLTDPALAISDLPPLDLIVLSHFHGDHFDQVAERELDRATPIVTTAQAAKELAQRGFTQTHALARWSTLDVVKGQAHLRLTALPAKHGPGLVDLALPDVNGSLLTFEGPEATPIFHLYISGDTLLIDELAEIPRRYPAIDLGLLHLGGTKVLGILVTMDAAQGVQALHIVQPRRAIPIHYDDYDVFTSPLSDFQQAVEAAGLAERVHYLDRGETYTFTASPSRPG